MSETTRRYLISTAITFASGFLVIVAPAIQSLTVDSVQDGVLMGLFIAGARAGVKAVAETFMIIK
jgi:hypothetical protein